MSDSTGKGEAFRQIVTCFFGWHILSDAMSFLGDRDTMQFGDLVILHTGQQRSMLSITLTKDVSYQTSRGCVRHNDLVGRPYGTKLDCARGYVYALRPTPELWTVNLPHRTQILYSTDISLVVMELEIGPGSVVVESGTGSGSLSHAILRTIAPAGHLYTYEFHEQRAKTAQQEFLDHGLGDYVTVTHRDVISEGFTVENAADAVFLDLPNPQEAVSHAKKALKRMGGRFCSFSPCIEQVQRTCLNLSTAGFVELKTVECLLRQFEVKTCVVSRPPMGPLGDLTHVKNPDGFPGLLARDGENYVFKSAVAPSQQPGHTGFLTFATLYAEPASAAT